MITVRVITGSGPMKRPRMPIQLAATLKGISDTTVRACLEACAHPYGPLGPAESWMLRPAAPPPPWCSVLTFMLCSGEGWHSMGASSKSSSPAANGLAATKPRPAPGICTHASRVPRATYMHMVHKKEPRLPYGYNKPFLPLAPAAACQHTVRSRPVPAMTKCMGAPRGSSSRVACAQRLQHCVCFLIHHQIMTIQRLGSAGVYEGRGRVVFQRSLRRGRYAPGPPSLPRVAAIAPACASLAQAHGGWPTLVTEQVPLLRRWSTAVGMTGGAGDCCRLCWSVVSPLPPPLPRSGPAWLLPVPVQSWRRSSTSRSARQAPAALQLRLRHASSHSPKVPRRAAACRAHCCFRAAPKAAIAI